jgi:hypothetical protein
VQIRSDCNGEIGGCYGGYWAHRFSIAEQRANFLPPVRSRSSCIVEQCHGKDRYQKVWSPAQAGALTISAIGSSRHFALPQDFGRTRGQRPADFETRLKFGMALTRLAAEDPAVHRLVAEVQSLLKPRSVYRDDPDLMRRVSAIMAQV